MHLDLYHQDYHPNPYNPSLTGTLFVSGLTDQGITYINYNSHSTQAINRLLLTESRLSFLAEQPLTLSVSDSDCEHYASVRHCSSVCEPSPLLKQWAAKIIDYRVSFPDMPRVTVPQWDGQKGTDVYCDGGTGSTDHKSGGSAAVSDNEIITDTNSAADMASGVVSDVAEINSARLSLRHGSNIILHTDSDAVFAMLTGSCKKIRDVSTYEAYCHLIREVEIFRQHGNIYINKVKGHSGIAGNETADRIARKVAEANFPYADIVKSNTERLIADRQVAHNLKETYAKLEHCL